MVCPKAVTLGKLRHVIVSELAEAPQSRLQHPFHARAKLTQARRASFFIDPLDTPADEINSKAGPPTAHTSMSLRKEMDHGDNVFGAIQRVCKRVQSPTQWR